MIAACGTSEPTGSSEDLGHSEFLDTLRRVEVGVSPVVAIGLDESASESAFVDVRWAALSGDSLLVVGDAGGRRVGTYALDGAFRGWVGGVGEGPGEFQLPLQGGVTEGGDIWVADPGRRRLLVYGLQGQSLETIRLRTDPVETSVLGVDRAGGGVDPDRKTLLEG